MRNGGDLNHKKSVLVSPINILEDEMKSNRPNKLLRCGAALSLIKEQCNITITHVTLRDWGRKNGFARKIGGRWYYDPKKMIQYIQDGSQ